MKDNQKGFSMVELIVVIAILGVFGACVFRLFSTGSRSYRNISQETAIQNEAQISMNQIEDIIIDAHKALTYSYTSGGTTNKIINDSGLGSVDSKTLKVYNDTEIYIIEWVAADKKIYLQKNAVDIYGNETAGNRSLMAEFVTGFSIALDDAESKNKVGLNIKYESSDGNKQYTVDKQIRMRNDLAINNITDIFQPAPPEPKVSKVSIILDGTDVSETSVAKLKKDNNAITFQYIANVVGTDLPDMSVSWAITGNTSPDTKISDDGLLTIAADESISNAIIITAKSKVDNSKSTWSCAYLKQITGVKLSIDSTTKKTYYQNGDVILVNASLNGSNLSADEKNYSWNATGATRLNTYPINSGTQEYKITGNPGTKFSITALSTADNRYSDTIEYDISKNHSISIAWLDKNPTTQMNLGGETSSITATVDPDDGKYGNITWKIVYARRSYEDESFNHPEYYVAESGKPEDSTKFYIKGTGSTIKIKAGNNLPLYNEWKIGVQAYIKVDGVEITSNIMEVTYKR